MILIEIWPVSRVGSCRCLALTAPRPDSRQTPGVAARHGGQKADQNVEPGADFQVFEVHSRALFLRISLLPGALPRIAPNRSLEPRRATYLYLAAPSELASAPTQNRLERYKYSSVLRTFYEGLRPICSICMGWLEYWPHRAQFGAERTQRHCQSVVGLVSPMVTTATVA